MSAHNRSRSPSAGPRDDKRPLAAAHPAHAPTHLLPDYIANTTNTTTTSSATTSLPYQSSLDSQRPFHGSFLAGPQQNSANYLAGADYSNLSAQQNGQLPAQDPNTLNGGFLQSQGLNTSNTALSFGYPGSAPEANGASLGAYQSSYNQQSNTFTNPDSNEFPSFDFNQPPGFAQGDALDESLLGDIDPSSLDLIASQQGIDISGQSLNDMATMQQSVATPPHLLPQHHSNTPSPHASPNPTQAHLQNMSRGRAVSESLDPSSALYPPGQNEWSQMYRGHRHTPSDAFSDVSSHSNQASPYLPTLDSFGPDQSSPLLNPSNDPSFHDGLGLQQFSLNDGLPSHRHLTPSPGHSPHISPRLSPQQPLPPFTAENNFGLNHALPEQYLHQQQQQPQQQDGLEMFPGMGQETFPAVHQSSPNDMGQADALSPPEINIDYAPPSRNPVDNPRQEQNGEALSPPMRAPSRSRSRAKSDSYAGSRPTSPSMLGRGRSPSLQPTLSDANNLLPFDQRSNASRSPSPASHSTNGSASRSRSPSAASENRDYILDLANPERTPNAGDNRRAQKHPATFQCTLCPKKFTRAYNLRSHLRTHTDERPFVCTVCGKAFARQHDRKRHEGLHSGEKRFVCRGPLQSGANWGCSRRFARADALGRHFRSEAGRVCIKPLLDEEAAERHRAMLDDQQAQGHLLPSGSVPMQQQQAPLNPNLIANFLPAAILQQYPVLAGIDWNSIPTGPTGPEDDYVSGRSSFDASSGGEIYDDMSDGEALSDHAMGGMHGMPPHAQMQAMNPNSGYATGVYGSVSRGGESSYLANFEGR